MSLIPPIPEAGDLGTAVDAHAGFPNAATDEPSGVLSLDQLLVPSPHSTYFFRVRGHRFERMGIFDGDIAIVDRAKSVKTGLLVVSWTDVGELIIAKWHKDSDVDTIWGTITTVIHQF